MSLKMQEETKTILLKLDEIKEELVKTRLSFIEELVKPENAVRIRGLYRAVNGSEITIPFHRRNGVLAGGELILVSNVIPHRFSVQSVSARFRANADDNLTIRFFVSEDSETTATGYNLLSNVSALPFLSGSDSFQVVSVNPEEFREGRFIKIQASNTGTTPLTLDASVTIRAYPAL